MSSSYPGAWLAPACSDKTRSDLEWDRLLEALADRASGPLGKRAAKTLGFHSTRTSVLRALDEVREAFGLLLDDEPLPGGEAPIITGLLERLRASGVLAPDELLAVAKVLAKARVLRRFLDARKQRVVLLHEACATDPQLDAVAQDIRDCFEPDGTLSDHASPRLRELRQERQKGAAAPAQQARRHHAALRTDAAVQTSTLYGARGAIRVAGAE